MRYLAILIGLLVASSVGCKRATDPATPASLVLTRAFDYQGRITHVDKACGQTPGPVLSPGGYGCEYDVWFATPPGTATDAGFVAGDSTPVFVGAQASFSMSMASALSVGDMVQLWTDGVTAYNATNCAPGTPCYVAAQIVIVR